MMRWINPNHVKIRMPRGASANRFCSIGSRFSIEPQIFGLRRLSYTEKCPPPQYDTGCTFCEVKFPKDKPINYEHDLNGTAAVPWKHVLVLSHGVEDFDEMPSKINMIPDSLASDFELVKRKMLSPMHPVTLSNASICGQPVTGKRHRVRVYPDNVEVEFERSQLEDFVQAYLVPKETAQVYNPFKTDQKVQPKPKKDLGKTPLIASKIKRDLVLICGHTKRDIRCGLLAPPLEAEFRRVLEKEQLSQQVEVGRISHIGGHVYAGNVIYFAGEGTPIWYGRVFPSNVQGIVSETIQKGNIIRELYRGPSDA